MFSSTQMYALHAQVMALEEAEPSPGGAKACSSCDLCGSNKYKTWRCERLQFAQKTVSVWQMCEYGFDVLIYVPG